MPPRRNPRTNDGGGPAVNRRPPSVVKRECKLFKQGSCRFGENCKFLHVAARVEPPIASSGALDVISVNGWDDSVLTLGGQIESDVEATAVPVQPAAPAANTLAAAGGSSPLTPRETGVDRENLTPRAPKPGRQNRSRGRGRGKGGLLTGLGHLSQTPSSPSTTPSALPAPNVGEGQIGFSFKQNNPCPAWQMWHCWRGDQCMYGHAGESSAQRKEREARMRIVAEERERRRREVEENRRLQAEEEQRQRQEQQEEERRQEAERQERERQERERQEGLAREREAEEARRLEEMERVRLAAVERRRKEREEREERERQKIEKLKRNELQKRQREAKFTLQLLVQGSNLVTFGPGFEVKRVIPGFDLCKIVIRKLPKDANRQEICNLFREQGMDDTMFQFVYCRNEGDSQIAEFLMRKEEARVMAIGLDGLEFRDNLLEFEVGISASLGSMTSSTQANDAKTLTVLWSRPSAMMIATYDTVDMARRKAKELNHRTVGTRKITATMNNKPNGPAARYWVEASVRIGNLGSETTVLEVQAVAGTPLVRAIKSNIYDFDFFLAQFKAALERSGCIAGSFKTVSLDAVRMKAEARFPDRESLGRAAAMLERPPGFGGFPILNGPQLRVIVPTEHQYTISILMPQYKAQKAQWDEMTEGARGQKAFVRVNERRNGRVLINVQGSDQREIGPLKVRVEGLVAGERLDNEHWHSTFTNLGKDLLDRVMGETGVFVSVDQRMYGLRLFGRGDKLADAKRIIREEVERLELMEWDIPIARQSVRFFVATGLQILKDSLGEDNVTLDVAAKGGCKIKLRGGDDAIQQARKLVEEAVTATQVGLPPPNDDDGDNICPICYDTASHPEVLSCGHSCCEPCLRHYLTSGASSDKFPLICMGDEATCNTPISIPVIERYLTKQRYNHLVDTAFSSYIQSNPRKFKYCTTPDCTQIYQCDTDQQFHQCTSCFSKICSSCNEEAHEGMTCEERRIQSDPAEQDRLNEEWANANNIKRCPSCNVLTEKTEGCNHMTCPCGTHFCWLCRGVFTATTVYGHMETAHGGIYGADPVYANPAPPPVPVAAPPRINDPLNAGIYGAVPVYANPAPPPVPVAAPPRVNDPFDAWRRRDEQVDRVAEIARQQRLYEAIRERELTQARIRRFALEEHARRQEEQRQEVARAEAERKRGGFCAIM